jgi:hypothetical protein
MTCLLKSNERHGVETCLHTPRLKVGRHLYPKGMTYRVNKMLMLCASGMASRVWQSVTKEPA